MPKLYLAPNGTGAQAQHTPVGAASNWAALTTDNGDTSYNRAVTVGDMTETFRTDSVAVANPPSGLLGAVRSVQAEIKARFDLPGDYDTISAGVRVGSGIVSGPVYDLEEIYKAFLSTAFTARPAGGAWTWADVQNAQFNYLSSLLDGGAPTESRISWGRLIVVYVGVLAPSSVRETMDATAATFVRTPPPVSAGKAELDAPFAAIGRPTAFFLPDGALLASFSPAAGPRAEFLPDGAPDVAFSPTEVMEVTF